MAGAVLAVLCWPGSAAAARGPSPDSRISPNWSGYVLTAAPGVRYSSATGTWKEPAVSCMRDRHGFSTIAVGLGGYGGNAQSDEQVGADANCAMGKPRYFGWFDLAPYPSYTVPHAVHAGDVLTATVTILADSRPAVVSVELDNRTAGWRFTRQISWVSAGRFLVAPGAQNTGIQALPDGTSAEWLVEAPASCVDQVCSQASLANFGSVAMTGISAVADGVTGTLSSPAWHLTRLRLVPGRVRVPSYPRATPFARNPPATGQAASPAGATPGDASTDGRSFKVKWKVAPKGSL
jgi:Peptidase A4 family